MTSLIPMSTHAPLSLPIKSVADLLAWEPGLSNSNTSQAHGSNLGKISERITNRPKVLLCHDMKGGYLADRFDLGCVSPDEEGFGFSFWHWSHVDVFVYFSHELVTIPPRSWIELAHSNNVKVLGTFITEFKTGTDIWYKELTSPAIIDLVVDKLTAISEYYGFDGWLINIENEVCGITDLVLKLVSRLTFAVHEKNPAGEVIWYDSVTLPDGKLNWQNELNCKNETFFTVCDGIFVNYTWKAKNLENSFELARKYNRQFDVYVGVDVFGRNCFGGGGFNTRLALEEIAKFKLSVAIFAFGWVYETMDSCNFVANQQKFWNLLADLLPIVRQNVVPFSTVFSLSYGRQSYWLGQKCSNGPWHNLPLQTPCHILENSSQIAECKLVDKGDAFIGSSCLEISICPSMIPDSPCGCLKLFSVVFPSDGDYFLCVGYKWRNNSDDNYVSLDIVAQSSDEPVCSLALSGTCDDETWQLDSTRFPISAQSSILTLATKPCKESPQNTPSSLLLGFIGIYPANGQGDRLSNDEIVEHIKANVKLSKFLCS